MKRGSNVVCAIYGQQQSLAKTIEETQGGKAQKEGRTVCNCLRMRGLLIYLTGEQLSINAHQKEILLAKSSQYIQPTPCHCVSSSKIPLGLAGHLGLGDCMSPTGLGPSLHPTTLGRVLLYAQQQLKCS